MSHAAPAEIGVVKPEAGPTDAFMPSVDRWSDAEEERAAIAKHDGGIPRDWAEGFARLNPERPPADVPLKRWQRFVDDVGIFLESRQDGQSRPPRNSPARC
jgi:hypothetical protein